MGQNGVKGQGLVFTQNNIEIPLLNKDIFLFYIKLWKKVGICGNKWFIVEAWWEEGVYTQLWNFI